MRSALILLAAAASFAPRLAAQNPEIRFFFRTAQSTTATEVFANGTLTAQPTLVNQKSTATLIINNRSNSTVTLRSATATGAFNATLTSTVIDAGQQVNINLEFSPRIADQLTGNLTLVLAPDPSRTISYQFFLIGQGTAPDFVVSYILNPGGNQVAVGNGGIIQFDRTTLGATATATIAILNRGTGNGTLNSVSVSGDAFRLSGVPLLPLEIVSPRGQIQFTLTFNPTTIDPANGTLQLTFADQTVRVQITGQGLGPVLRYSLSSGGTLSQLTPGATVNLPDTQVGETTTATFTIENNGNGEARLNSIVLTGTGFTAVDTPGLPFTLPVGSALNITIRFTPTQVGPTTATLRVDNAAFTIRGTGVGRSLRLTGIVGSNSVPIAAGGTLSFQNSDIGVPTRATIEITNAGNADAIVNVISVTPAASGFTIPDPIALPLTIPPGQKASFVITFIPENTGASTATLQVEDISVTLRGSGNTPPPVPPVQFIGLPASVAAREQPSVSLKLERTYPLDLTGQLTVGFASDSFGDDPAIVFSNNARTVNFRIPANTTDARFVIGTTEAPDIRFQTGTVVGTITLSATLATARVNLTPSPAPARSTSVTADKPELATPQVSSRSATAVTLLVTGYSTPRSVTTLNFTFAAAAGAGTLQTNSLSFNAEEAFRAWYQSEASRQFGSQFTATINLQVNGDVNSIQSITVTAANSRGTSSPVTVSLR